ncbi:MAG: hypothetical protein EKK53_20290 [Burkholderiales bacterium]|nr:MAG: hypothetical protein EKK53_20290 [Burkholderiales bacterium]
MVSPLDDALKQSLSALMDGQATEGDWARVRAAWDQDPALRDTWAAWQATSDGLHAPDLPPLHQSPQALLDALHARSADERPARSRVREWTAPLAVAATFVAISVGIGLLRPPAPSGAVVAAAPIQTPHAQGLSGLSFAQTATGRTLAGDPAPDGNVIDWGLALPEPAASRPGP